jgi:aspartate/methionine/tyrosine aminotransferase
LEEILKKAPKEVKLICLIDPNNPTGFICEESFLKRIAKFAEEKNSIIVSDEIYADFFFEKEKSIVNYAKNRTVLLSGRSKIERSTGLRFGEYIVNKEAQKYIFENIFKGDLGSNGDFMGLLHNAKAPGGMDGAFQHTTFVPGPSQYLGLAHMIFGKDDREEYLRRIRVNMESFYEILGLEYKKNLYYASFDLLDIKGCKKGEMAPEELFLELAKKGVVLLPINLFYSEEERTSSDRRTHARACVPNLNFTGLTRAAKTIKEFMTS